MPSVFGTLVRSAIAAGLVLASSASAAQGAVTLYGGARTGGEFTDENAGGSAIKLDSGAPKLAKRVVKLDTRLMGYGYHIPF